jgi:polyphosphate kinase
MTYLKRDLSWLSFNHRVLQEAMDPDVPLYDRLKFLAIYSANLDEFYRVRVASLRSFKKLKKKTRKQLHIDVKPKKELRLIREIVGQQQALFGRIFKEELRPALTAAGIHLLRNEDYNSEQRAFAKRYFREQVRPHLSPHRFLAGEELPFLENQNLYFAIALQAEGAYALLPLPTGDLPRFVELPTAKPGQHYFSFLDDIIRDNLSELLGQEVAEAYAIKVSRDAELYIEDEYDGDLVQKIQDSLAARSIGLPTRFLYDNRMPSEMLALLKHGLALSKHDLIPGARYHNFNDFFGFPLPEGLGHLKNEELAPLPHPDLEQASSLLDYMREQDAILHFPYQRYGYVPRLMEEAAQDPDVEHIKITLYRVAKRSAVVDALLKARANGKAVTVFVEIKARFDEAANLYWGKELEKAGAKVLYSKPGIKVHTKLLLIARREAGQLRQYAYLGTGNFNEKTARLYADHALLTADPRLAEEAAQVFLLLEGTIQQPKCEHILVSPFTTRPGFEALLDKEVERAKTQSPHAITLKMNSLEDPSMVEKLYAASQAGLSIRMIVRGICCALPSQAGLSDNLQIISIVDRFLEHARVYDFGDSGLYLASADWMTRNLDHRVEIAFPIYDERIAAELRHVLNLQWQDNTKARLIDAEQTNPYRQADGPPLRSQVAIYRWLEGLRKR